MTRPVWILAYCHTCDAQTGGRPMPIPFPDVDARARWISGHVEGNPTHVTEIVDQVGAAEESGS